MKTIIRGGLAALLLVLVVSCGNSGRNDVRSKPNINEGVNIVSTTAGDGETATADGSLVTEAKPAGPAGARASAFVGGNVDPAFGPGEPGQLSVIAIGSPDGEESSIPFVVRNNTDGPVYGVAATGRATNEGMLVGSGESQSVEPAVVAPGEIAFGYVYFSAEPPAGSTIEVSATADSKSSRIFRSVAMIVGEANLVAGTYGHHIVGAVVAPADVEVSGPVGVTVLCVDPAGAITGNSTSFTDGQASILPGASATYSVDIYDDCPTFLIGSSGYDM